MGLILVTAPAEEPVTLTEAKLQLRVDTADEDTLITTLIAAARQYAEGETRRALCSQTWKLVLDAFPGGWRDQSNYLGDSLLRKNAILLEKGNVQSVTSVRYLDTTGGWQTMPSTDYVVGNSMAPARITPAFGKIWPVTQPQIEAVEVTFVAGYGTASQVPQGIKNWMLVRLSSLYVNREEVAAGRVTPLPYVDHLLDQYRVEVY